MRCPHCGREIDMALMASRMGMKGGSVTSEVKAEAARRNGKRGGRPRKESHAREGVTNEKHKGNRK